ncbi:MAG: hypothetical protein LBC27_03360, partial [Spirochaetaceae bacterium]|nr:hypothetical protein [Spirochaetaceae bacterium]
KDGVGTYNLKIERVRAKDMFKRRDCRVVRRVREKLLLLSGGFTPCVFRGGGGGVSTDFYAGTRVFRHPARAGREALLFV